MVEFKELENSTLDVIELPSNGTGLDKDLMNQVRLGSMHFEVTFTPTASLHTTSVTPRFCANVVEIQKSDP